jgi:hypothetical protein
MDTSDAARARQIEVLRRLSGPDRLRLAFQISLIARGMTLARLRRQHPEWSDAQATRELIRYAFDRDPAPPPLQ